MRAVKLWVDSVRDKDQNPQWYVQFTVVDLNPSAATIVKLASG